MVSPDLLVEMKDGARIAITNDKLFI